MRTLLILRHGKAEHDDGGSDRERALTKRGKRAAEAIASVLLDERLLPDRIIASSAVRARDTARRVASKAHYQGPLDELDELYLAEPGIYVAAVARLAGDAERVLVVGHNPALEALVALLTGELTVLPTGALAECALPISSFSELTLAVRGKLRMVWRPKDLDD